MYEYEQAKKRQKSKFRKGEATVDADGFTLSREEVYKEKRLVVWLWRANGSTFLDWRREVEAIKGRKGKTGSMLPNGKETTIGYVFFSG